MQVLFGIIFHFIGGFASGSFYIPYKKVKQWQWENFWIVGGLFSWLIVPPLAAWVTIPGFWGIIHNTSGNVLWYTYLFGTLWGIGGLTFGLGLRYLGVSLGSTIILGLDAACGALIPSIYYDIFPKAGKITFAMLLHSSWGRVILLGIVVCLAGIIVCGKAGTMKEKEIGQATNKEYHFRIGLLVALVSGLLSACFNFGLEAGKPIAETANSIWQAAHPGRGNFLFRNNVVYVVLLWGGLTTNLVWCMILNVRNKSLGDYTNAKSPLLKNYLFCALGGTAWFLQFFFYGMGESKLGNGASSWILHMAFIIFVANLWGLALKEWKGVSKKTFATVIAGIALVILSVVIVGYGNILRK